MLRFLNSLIQKKEFKRLGMPRGSKKLNHMTFMDDMINICKVDMGTMNMMGETLRKYE